MLGQVLIPIFVYAHLAGSGGATTYSNDNDLAWSQPGARKGRMTSDSPLEASPVSQQAGSSPLTRELQAKNIVICCDGTGNEFGDRNSNVIKLHKALIHDATQLVYYHPGVGTMGARNALSPIGKWWTKVIGLAFGYGISDNIADAYQFL